MNICGTKIEECCVFLLQKNAAFELKNKTLKTGKIELYSQRNFYLVFHLVNAKKNKRDKMEVPIPFNVEIHEAENLVYFDYRISTLSKYSPESLPYLNLCAPKTKVNKFWDTILTINANETYE